METKFINNWKIIRTHKTNRDGTHSSATRCDAVCPCCEGVVNKKYCADSFRHDYCKGCSATRRTQIKKGEHYGSFVVIRTRIIKKSETIKLPHSKVMCSKCNNVLYLRNTHVKSGPCPICKMIEKYTDDKFEEL